MRGADRLVEKANQIARNLEASGEIEAVAATAEHIRLYWDPRMTALILTADRASLSPIAAAAIEKLEA